MDPSQPRDTSAEAGRKRKRSPVGIRTGRHTVWAAGVPPAPAPPAPSVEDAAEVSEDDDNGQVQEAPPLPDVDPERHARDLAEARRGKAREVEPADPSQPPSSPLTRPFATPAPAQAPPALSTGRAEEQNRGVLRAQRDDVSTQRQPDARFQKVSNIYQSYLPTSNNIQDSPAQERWKCMRLNWIPQPHRLPDGGWNPIISADARGNFPETGAVPQPQIAERTRLANMGSDVADPRNGGSAILTTLIRHDSPLDDRAVDFYPGAQTGGTVADHNMTASIANPGDTLANPLLISDDLDDVDRTDQNHGFQFEEAHRPQMTQRVYEELFGLTDEKHVIGMEISSDEEE